MASPTGWWDFVSYQEIEKEERKGLSWNLVWNQIVPIICFPYRFRIFVVFFCIVFSTVLSMVPPFLVRMIVDQALVRDDDGLLLNTLVPWLVVIPLLSGLIEVLQKGQSGYVSTHIMSDLRALLFNHFQKFGIGFYTETKTGEITSRIQYDVTDAQWLVTGVFVPAISNIITVFFALGFLFSVDFYLTICSIAIIPLFYVPARVVAAKVRKISGDCAASDGKLSAYLAEVLTRDGIFLMRLFGRKERNAKDFKERNDDHTNSRYKSKVVSAWFSMFMGLITAVGTAVIYWYGGFLVRRGELSIGTIIAFSSYLGMLYSPIASLMNSHVELVSCLVAFERIFEVLSLPIEVKEKENGLDVSNFEGAISFKNVSFSYDPLPQDSEEENGSSGKARLRTRKRDVFYDSYNVNRSGKTADYDSSKESFSWVLQDISFRVRPGDTVALVGPSGAGKSTVLSLLPRLYDPTKGEITIDSHNLKDLSFLSLSKAVGMVAQDTFLFHDTIKNNLLYARPDATEMELIEACEAAHILDVILDWPDKWDTIVGERGYRLSGGEKQRVSIARVILQDPKIIILDEATASLDSRSEEAIQNALQKLYEKKQHSFLVIAHRLSTVLSADQILVVDKGRIIERGTHQQLLKMEGLYTTLYHTQFGNEKEEKRKKGDLDALWRLAESY